MSFDRVAELNQLDRVRAALGLRSDIPARIFTDADQRELAEYLAVAEGPVPFVDLVDDCFDGDGRRCGDALLALDRAGVARSCGDGHASYKLTPAGRALLSVKPVAA